MSHVRVHKTRGFVTRERRCYSFLPETISERLRDLGHGAAQSGRDVPEQYEGGRRALLAGLGVEINQAPLTARVDGVNVNLDFYTGTIPMTTATARSSRN